MRPLSYACVASGHLGTAPKPPGHGLCLVPPARSRQHITSSFGTRLMDRHYESSTHSNSGAALHPADFIRLLRTHIRWWAVPAVVFAVLAGAYSLVAPREWRATQALIVRPESASVSEERLGKFADLSEMKTLQETILELAKSQSVVQATLREVGPPSGCRNASQW